MSSSKTGIEWTDKTWNPTTGCTKVSPGCHHCYAEAMTTRFPKAFPTGFNFTIHQERLEQPKKWRTPSRIFVNSMSDLFHENLDFGYLQEIFAVMRDTPCHIYQILTKRPQKLATLADKLEWSENIWMGVSVESQQYTHRIEALKTVPAKVRFLSCEPLLGPLNLDLSLIDWVIVGGESGHQYRQMKLDWARNIRNQCQDLGVAFFFKQVGGKTPKAGGRLLDGEIWDEMPNAWSHHTQKWGSVSIIGSKTK